MSAYQVNPKGRYEYFKWLPINTYFSFNGSKCIKRTSRTAEYIEYGRRFYFAQKDLCIVGDYSPVWNVR